MMVSFVNIFKFLILKMKKIFVHYNAALLRCLPIMTCFKPRIRRVWRVLVSAAAVKCCSISFQAKPRLHSFFIFQTRISNGLKSIFNSTATKIVQYEYATLITFGLLRACLRVSERENTFYFNKRDYCYDPKCDQTCFQDLSFFSLFISQLSLKLFLSLKGQQIRGRWRCRCGEQFSSPRKRRFCNFLRFCNFGSKREKARFAASTGSTLGPFATRFLSGRFWNQSSTDQLKPWVKRMFCKQTSLLLLLTI